MFADLCLGMAIAVFALMIAWRIYRSRSKQLAAIVALFTVIGIMYYLYGYTVPELMVTLSICVIACTGIVSAFRLAIQGSEAGLLIEFALPEFRGLLSKLYQGILSYTLLFVSSIAMAALLSMVTRNLFTRFGMAVAVSLVISYVLKRIGKLSIALIAFTALALAAYIVAPDIIASDLRSFDEWLRLIEAVIGGVG